MRSLGLVVGDLWSVIRTGKARTPVERTVVRRDTQEARVNTPAGEVTLRRTTIDEVERRTGG
jgi:hypothetical protein